MTPPNYLPTQAPGDIRRRVRAIHITCPVGQVYSLEALEQTVVHLADGETSIDDQAGRITADMTPTRLALQFPIRSPIDDSDTGATATFGEALTIVYSAIRAMQADRDNAALQEIEE